MKLIPLTRGKFAIVDDDMYDELNKHKWRCHADRGTFSAVREVNKDGQRWTERMHHRVLPRKKGMVVDHKDRNPLNNLRSNLRHATQWQNTMNRVSLRGRSRFKNVSWDEERQKWAVFIGYRGKCRFIGRFEDEVDAAIAANVAAQIFYGEFACLNPV